MVNEIALIASLYCIFGLFEVSFPAQREQTLSGRLRNIGYAALLYISGIIIVSCVFLLIPFHFRQLADHGALFSFGILFLYILLTDTIFYWYHRAQHSFGFLWVIHELHHSDKELNATTSKRTYWLDLPIQTLIIGIPVNYIIGIDTKAVIMLPIFMLVWLFFTHANVRLRMGFLTSIISGPQLHRIHHSNLPEHQNKNLAQFFPLLDILFGTYYKPRVDEFPTTGTTGLASDAPMVEVILKPFKTWLRQISGI